MTVTDQIKILCWKIMQNETQYDLDRKAAKMSALSVCDDVTNSKLDDFIPVKGLTD